MTRFYSEQDQDVLDWIIETVLWVDKLLHGDVELTHVLDLAVHKVKVVD